MSFFVGQKVEVKYDGEWWNAEVLDVERKKVYIHYVGGKLHVHVSIQDCTANNLNTHPDAHGMVLLQGRMTKMNGLSQARLESGSLRYCACYAIGMYSTSTDTYKYIC